MESLMIESSIFRNTAHDVVPFAEAHIVPIGKTGVERRLSIVSEASFAAQVFLSSAKGKVGAAAREGVSVMGAAMIAKAALSGNYRPAAEALAVTLNCSIHFSTRAAWESFDDVLQSKYDQLKNGGYRISGKTGVEEPTTARKELDAARSLYRHILELIRGEAAKRSKQPAVERRHEDVAPQGGTEVADEDVAPQGGTEDVAPQGGTEDVAPQGGTEDVAPQGGTEVAVA
jgi:hypothetical protein